MRARRELVEQNREVYEGSEPGRQVRSPRSARSASSAVITPLRTRAFAKGRACRGCSA